MKWITSAHIRCGICHRIVSADTRERARWALEPLIVCDECVREADRRWSLSRQPEAAVAA